MGDLLTLRMEEKDKRALALSSTLSEMPISKVIMPYLNEGINTSLGGILLFHIDRSMTFDKRSFNNFTSILIEPTRTGAAQTPARGPEDVERTSPRVIWDFFDILSELKVIEKLNNTFEAVTLSMDTSFVTPAFLRALCFRLGEAYIRSGGNLERLDYQLSNELFFKMMLDEFYQFNATGTTRSLRSELYMHQTRIKDLSLEMVNCYSERSKTRKFQAIEVASDERKRGRPSIKKRRKKIEEVLVVEEV